MTLRERIQSLAAALPSGDAKVILSKASLLELLEGSPVDDGGLRRDLTVEEVAKHVGRSPSTVRDWLQAGSLEGYKLNNRDWRVRTSDLQRYLDRQSNPPTEGPALEGDISDWRRV